MENLEIMPEEVKRETKELAETTELPDAAGSMALEAAEQQEMDAFTEVTGTELEAAEQREMDEGAKLGYSSSYYEHRMASALESGNKTAYKNHQRDWAKAKVKEETRR